VFIYNAKLKYVLSHIHYKFKTNLTSKWLSNNHLYTVEVYSDHLLSVIIFRSKAGNFGLLINTNSNETHFIGTKRDHYASLPSTNYN